MTIYVGNLAYAATVEGLRDLFAPHGEITKVIIPTDRETGRPRGFAFIEMASEGDEDSVCALYESQDLEYLDRMLKINKAKPKEEGGPRGDRPSRPRSSFGSDRPPRSGNGGGYGGGSRSGSGERRSSFGGSSSNGGSGERRPRRSYDN